MQRIYHTCNFLESFRIQPFFWIASNTEYEFLDFPLLLKFLFINSLILDLSQYIFDPLCKRCKILLVHHHHLSQLLVNIHKKLLLRQTFNQLWMRFVGCECRLLECGCSSWFPHPTLIFHTFGILFIDDTGDNFFNIFLFDFSDIVAGCVFLVATLYEFDVLKVVDSGHDDIFLEIGSFYFNWFC